MIRVAEEKDIEIISNIIVKTWKTAYQNIVDPEYADNLPLEKYVKIFTKNIREKKEIIFVNEDNSVNGFISGITTEGKYDCEIIGLYVLPEYQEKGIGKKLVKHIIKTFQEKGKSNLLIWTLDGARNNSFYKSLDAEKTEYKELEFGARKYKGVGFNLKI